MCRWLAYSGSPILLEELLYKPKHSLIVPEPALEARRRGRRTATASASGGTALARRPPSSTASSPRGTIGTCASSSGHIISPLVFAHIRASTGAPVQQTNCHPFRYGQLAVDAQRPDPRLPRCKRDLALAVDPSLYPQIEGSTDSEVFFFLALTFGLEDDPAGRGRAGGRVRRGDRAASRRRAPDPGDDGDDRRREHLGVPLLERAQVAFALLQHRRPGSARPLPGQPAVPTSVDDERRLVVSEPLGDLAGRWNEVPESSWGVVQPGDDELHPFTPRDP